jgi:hypothetical protein
VGDLEEKEQKQQLAPTSVDGGTLLIQGRLADGWLGNAVSILVSSDIGKRHLLKNVFLSERHLHSRGIYTVRLFYQGSWRYTHLDDRIPCDTDGVPLYSRHADANCTWMCLLQKAFAKLLGGYSCLNYGSFEFAIRCLTGGVLWWTPLHRAAPSVQRHQHNKEGASRAEAHHREAADQTWTQLSELLQADPEVIAGVIASDPASPLCNGHVYAIKDVFELLVQAEQRKTAIEQDDNPSKKTSAHGIEYSNMLRLASLRGGFVEDQRPDEVLDQRWKRKHEALLRQVESSFLSGGTDSAFLMPTQALGDHMSYMFKVDFLDNQVGKRYVCVFIYWSPSPPPLSSNFLF